MAEAYRTDIAAGNVGLGEFIATRWLLKHTDIYSFFEEKIKGVTVDFETLEELPHDLSQALVQASIQQFGAKNTYLFSVFNSVVFPKDLYAELRKKAETQTQDLNAEAESIRTGETIEAMQHCFNREMKALTDRYEKKISGLQKKYLQDTESLKKQISALHKKLNPSPTNE